MTDATAPTPAAPVLAVGIITYKRPESLKRLLTALAAQKFENREPVPFAVVVVDNDAGGSARPVCDEMRSQLSMTYVVEPQQGIPLARNRVLTSLPDTTELVAWIDDDESPLPLWLDALVSTQAETEADIVMGAVEAVLPATVPAWIKKGGFFNRRRFVDRATLAEGATNNCLMKLSAIKGANLRFDEKLRYDGGSDTLFFRHAANAGLRMVWSSAAVVHDFIPLERCTLGWLVRRNFRAGTTLARCDVEIDGVGGWLRRLYHAFAKIAQGILNLPIAVAGRHELAKSVLMIVRGVGMIAGLFGVRYQEYAPGRLITAAG